MVRSEFLMSCAKVVYWYLIAFVCYLYGPYCQPPPSLFLLLPPSIRTLGTPDENSWPGVTSLPDYKTTFPNWPRQMLQNSMKGIDPKGVDLMEVCLKGMGRD